MSNLIPKKESLSLKEIINGVSYYIHKEYFDETSDNLDNGILFYELNTMFTDGLFLALKENNIDANIVVAEDEEYIFSCVKTNVLIKGKDDELELKELHINPNGDYFYTFDEVLDEMDYCGKREKENIEIINKPYNNISSDVLRFKKEILKYSYIYKEVKKEELLIKNNKEKLKTTDWGFSL